MTDNSHIIRFVKETLGCRCPDDVFKRIEFTREQKDARPCAKIIIGDRLLILVAEVKYQDSLDDLIESLFKEGRNQRDTLGLNRFRLVIAADEPDSIRERLIEKFESLRRGDDRLHLHVIAKSERLLASLLG